MAWFVNGERVEDSAVREEANQMRPRYMESVTHKDSVEAEMQLREWARENVIERILLRQAAFADSEPVPAEVIEEGLARVRSDAGGQVGCGTRTNDEDIKHQIESDYRVHRLLSRVSSSLKPPSDKQIAAFYKKNREEFRTPELCWAKHIVKNVENADAEAGAREAIEQAWAELQNGATFEELADKYSDCAGNGGDLGWFPRGEMVEEFEEQVFRLPVGGMSEIFRSPFGFHIAKVYGRKPAGYRPVQDVRDRIMEVLTEQERQQVLEKFIDNLRSKAEIRQGKGEAS